MTRLGVGFCLHPDPVYLELAAPIIEENADYLEMNPETVWRNRNGKLERNDYHAIYQKIHEASGKPFVAHGLGFSVGTPVDDEGEPARIATWLERLRDDHATFHFPYLTEHLGWTVSNGLQMVLPMPLPLTDEAVDVVATRMGLLQSVVPQVAFENWATTFVLDDAAKEPEFFNAICRRARCGLLLDLHNAYTQCVNFGLDLADYVERIDAENVLQIHLSGGSVSDPDWTASRRTMRLDSHDDAVPEEVWKALERVVPRCKNLRGVVVERLNGTFTEIGPLRDEVKRAKEVFKC